MKRAHLLLLALAVGVVYSFPNWWWHLTLPSHSILRGYILSDDDLVPYAAALNTSAAGLPPTAPLLRMYENREAQDPAAISFWATNLMLGSLMRLAGSLERFAALGLLLAGAASFGLVYLLARRLSLPPRGAVAVALLTCFRYPFYVSLVAVGRRAIESGSATGADSLFRVAFPGMVNGSMLYPLLRWPLPGMMFWWFLLGLLLTLSIWQRAPGAPARGGRWWAIAGAALFIGLMAHVYFYFWGFLLALLAFLAMVAWLTGRQEAARSLAVVSLGAALAAGLAIHVSLASPMVGPNAPDGRPLLALRPDRLGIPDHWPETAAVHGMLALAVAFSTAGASAGRNLARWWASLREPAQANALWLFALHAVTFLLVSLEFIGLRLEAWHWPEYLMHNFAPLTAGWLVARALARSNAANPGSDRAWRLSPGWALWPAICLLAAGVVWRAGVISLEQTLAAALGVGVIAPATRLAARLHPARGLALAAWVALPAWYYYHRTSNTLSWLAFLPLTIALAGWRPRLTRAAAWTLIGLNAALAVALQAWVRPILARDFFALPADYVAALRWLDRNTPADSVVVTNGWVSDYLIRGYTHNLTPAGADWWSGISRQESAERIHTRLAIYRTDPAALARLRANRTAIVAEFKAVVNDRWNGGPHLDILAEQHGVFGDARVDYAAFYYLPLRDLLEMRRIDYVWVGPWERFSGEADFQTEPGASLVYANPLIQIYAVTRD